MRKVFTSRAFAGALLAASGHSHAQTQARTVPITHVVIIMQENRSFDTYFGTYPGANGIPAGVCSPLDPRNPAAGCVVPFHDVHDVNGGGSHSAPNAQSDIDNGIDHAYMDGFIQQQSHAPTNCKNPNNPACAGSGDGIARHDVVGYHTDAKIPNYWAYAENFVLQDAMFEGVRTWSLPAHLDLTSEWVANCTDPTRVSTCTTTNNIAHNTPSTIYPWANLFQLMDVHNVTWKYYIDQGLAPDCEDDEMDCPPQQQAPQVPSYWNVPPNFKWVQDAGKAYLKLHNPILAQFYADVAAGTLPQVSWLMPTSPVSEHPPNSITAGMEYVTALINAIAGSPYWNNTAIFLAWDDWGGFYDHVVPPNVDMNSGPQPIQGFGIRVPGLLISAYAKHGYIDHSVLSPDSYATFIEDLFMGGARLDPAALGQPDARPDIRDALTSVTFMDGRVAKIGNLFNEFDFQQKPAKPLVLTTRIPYGIYTLCRNSTVDSGQACLQSTVTVVWQPLTGQYVPGPFIYHITRDGRDLPQCTGTATTCTDTPGSGNHFYRAFSVDTSGTASPQSAAAEADEP